MMSRDSYLNNTIKSSIVNCQYDLIVSLFSALISFLFSLDGPRLDFRPKFYRTFLPKRIEKLITQCGDIHHVN